MNKLILTLFVLCVNGILCDRGYGYKEPKLISKASLGMDLEIEKYDEYLDKDPSQLVLQLGDTGYKASAPAKKNQGFYKKSGYVSDKKRGTKSRRYFEEIPIHSQFGIDGYSAESNNDEVYPTNDEIRSAYDQRVSDGYAIASDLGHRTDGSRHETREDSYAPNRQPVREIEGVKVLYGAAARNMDKSGFYGPGQYKSTAQVSPNHGITSRDIDRPASGAQVSHNYKMIGREIDEHSNRAQVSPNYRMTASDIDSPKPFDKRSGAQEVMPVIPLNKFYPSIKRQMNYANQYPIPLDSVRDYQFYY